MKQNLIWLVSYPKSGNTWFRAFLSAIQDNGDIQDPDINDLYRTPIASHRGVFEEFTGLESSDLKPSEIQGLRPEVYEQLSNRLETPMYMKVHDAYTRTDEGKWLFPPEVTRSVVYLVRNPFDVAVSFASHSSKPLDTAVKSMCSEEFALAKTRTGLPIQLQQNHLTWSDHVLSWTRSPNRVCVLRYEDMKLNAFDTFKRAAVFLGFNKENKEIEAAIDRCSFKNLREQEEENNFREKPPKCRFFFRKGIVGSWREYLKPEHCEKLIQCHGEVMKEFGYLDDNLKIVF